MASNDQNRNYGQNTNSGQNPYYGQNPPYYIRNPNYIDPLDTITDVNVFARTDPTATSELVSQQRLAPPRPSEGVNTWARLNPTKNWLKNAPMYQPPEHLEPIVTGGVMGPPPRPFGNAGRVPSLLNDGMEDRDLAGGHRVRDMDRSSAENDDRSSPDSPAEIIRISAGTDGDPTHRPSTNTLLEHVSNPTSYLRRLAKAWMRQRGEAQPGASYTLDKLPEGYAVYGRPRPNDPLRVDNYLYGHPKHACFESVKKFTPHFLNLMLKGSSDGCPCAVCALPEKSDSPNKRAPADKNATPRRSRGGLSSSTIGERGASSRRGRGRGRPRKTASQDDVMASGK